MDLMTPLEIAAAAIAIVGGAWLATWIAGRWGG